jgi:hypothetical protein
LLARLLQHTGEGHNLKTFPKNDAARWANKRPFIQPMAFWSHKPPTATLLCVGDLNQKVIFVRLELAETMGPSFAPNFTNAMVLAIKLHGYKNTPMEFFLTGCFSNPVASQS